MKVYNLNIFSIHVEDMALIQAIQNGNLLRVQELLSSGEADANEKDERGNSALYNIIDYDPKTVTPNALEIFKTLVKHGADVNQKIEDNGWTLLQYVSANCSHPYYIEFLKELIRGGANVNETDNFNQNALHFVFFSGYIEKEFTAVQILIDSGANINGKNTLDGSTLLHRACSNGNLQSVRVFIKLGLNINEKDAHGHTPLNIAFMKNRAEIIQELLNCGADNTIKHAEEFHNISQINSNLEVS